MPELTQERLKELLHYDQETGVFTRLVPAMGGHRKAQPVSRPGCRVGDAVGSKRQDGRFIVGVDRRLYPGGQLAWFYAHGEWPRRLVYDDGNMQNIALRNLRDQPECEALTADLVRKFLAYDPQSGVFTWLRGTGKARPGEVAGCLNERIGYIIIGVCGHQEYAHRLAWLYVHGSLPQHAIDHINGNKTDNRIENLRDIPHWGNAQNRRSSRARHIGNRSDLVGAHWSERDQSWTSRIKTHDQQTYLGTFRTAEEAHAAYVTAKRKLHQFGTL